MKYIFVISLMFFFKVDLYAGQVFLDTTSGILSGSIKMPETDLPCPVALIIAGSGPTDRDGNSGFVQGSNDCLKMLAEGLADHGISSLRYDKRGVASSFEALSSEYDLRFETYISDAVMWCEQLRNDKRFSSLTVIGHSEGALIGMITVATTTVDSFISIAGPGRPVSQIILDQIDGQYSEEIIKQTSRIISNLKLGKNVTLVPKELKDLFRPSVQPYLISMFKYNPTDEIAKLKIPALILQGTVDIQVGVQDSKNLAQSYPSAELFIIEGMNHIMKDVSDNDEMQLKSYIDPTISLSSVLVEKICSFIRKTDKLEVLKNEF